jgi:hypothetical protein
MSVCADAFVFSFEFVVFSNEEHFFKPATLMGEEVTVLCDVLRSCGVADVAWKDEIISFDWERETVSFTLQ